MNRNFILRISLADITPTIWRQIKVSDDLSLYGLHHIIQISFGWKNYHLYQYLLHGIKFGNPELLDDMESINDQVVPFVALAKKEGDTLEYEYDFGDGWNHRILLEKILIEEHTLPFPICLAGERSAPPEDCGGPTGYDNLLSILKDKKHLEYKATKHWAGPFNPENCHLDDINNSLKAIDTYITRYENQMNS